MVILEHWVQWSVTFNVFFFSPIVVTFFIKPPFSNFLLFKRCIILIFSSWSFKLFFEGKKKNYFSNFHAISSSLSLSWCLYPRIHCLLTFYDIDFACTLMKPILHYECYWSHKTNCLWKFSVKGTFMR